MVEYIQRDTFHTRGWRSIVALAALLSGCACFILGCVAAMIISNKH